MFKTLKEKSAHPNTDYTILRVIGVVAVVATVILIYFYLRKGEEKESAKTPVGQIENTGVKSNKGTAQFSVGL